MDGALRVLEDAVFGPTPIRRVCHHGIDLAQRRQHVAAVSADQRHGIGEMFDSTHAANSWSLCFIMYRKTCEVFRCCSLRRSMTFISAMRPIAVSRQKASLPITDS